MATPKILGYGGSAVIDGTQVLINTGNFSQEHSIPYMDMLSVQPVAASRSRVKFAEGTYTCTGSLGFNVTATSMPLFSLNRLLQRGYVFDVGIHDGVNSNVLKDCVATTISLTGAVGGLISSTVSFSAAELWESGSVSNLFARDETPYGYWYSGNSALQVNSWTFTVNISVTPVFHNNYSRGSGNDRWLTRPSYFHIGLWNMSLEITTFENPPIETANTISVATKTFTLAGVRSSNEYSFGGQTELGTYAHTFESSATLPTGSSGIILTVS